MTLKKENIIEYIMLINIQFPNAYQFPSESAKELLINLWYEGLKGYPKELCDLAIRNALFKAEFAPKIATVIKEVEALIELQGKSDSGLWSELCEALDNIRSELPYASDRYDTVIHEDTGLTTAGESRKAISRVYDGLDPKLKEYCGSMRGFMDLAQMDELDLQYEKGRFLKQAPMLAERIKLKQQTPPQFVDLIKAIRESDKKKLIGAKKI